MNEAKKEVLFQDGGLNEKQNSSSKGVSEGELGERERERDEMMNDERDQIRCNPNGLIYREAESPDNRDSLFLTVLSVKFYSVLRTYLRKATVETDGIGTFGSRIDSLELETWWWWRRIDYRRSFQELSRDRQDDPKKVKTNQM